MTGWKKCAASIAVLTLICFFAAYGLVYMSLIFDVWCKNALLSVIAAFAPAVVLPGLDIIFAVVNSRKKMMSPVEADVTVLISSVVLAPAVIFLLPHLGVPVSLIPRQELGYEYLVLVIQIFAVAGIVLSFIVSLIAILVHRGKSDQ